MERFFKLVVAVLLFGPLAVSSAIIYHPPPPIPPNPAGYFPDLFSSSVETARSTSSASPENKLTVTTGTNHLVYSSRPTTAAMVPRDYEKLSSASTASSVEMARSTPSASPRNEFKVSTGKDGWIHFSLPTATTKLPRDYEEHSATEEKKHSSDSYTVTNSELFKELSMLHGLEGKLSSIAAMRSSRTQARYSNDGGVVSETSPTSAASVVEHQHDRRGHEEPSAITTKNHAHTVTQSAVPKSLSFLDGMTVKETLPATTTSSPIHDFDSHKEAPQSYQTQPTGIKEHPHDHRDDLQGFYTNLKYSYTGTDSEILNFKSYLSTYSPGKISTALAAQYTSLATATSSSRAGFSNRPKDDGPQVYPTPPPDAKEIHYNRRIENMLAQQQQQHEYEREEGTTHSLPNLLSNPWTELGHHQNVKRTARQSRTRTQASFDERPTLKVFHRVTITVDTGKDGEVVTGTDNIKTIDADQTATPTIKSAEDELLNGDFRENEEEIAPALLPGGPMYPQALVKNPVTDSGATLKHPHRGNPWWALGGPGPVMQISEDDDKGADKHRNHGSGRGKSEDQAPCPMDNSEDERRIWATTTVNWLASTQKATPIEAAPTSEISSPEDEVPSFEYRQFAEHFLDLTFRTSRTDARNPIAELHAFFRTRLVGNPRTTLLLTPNDDREIVRILSPLVLDGSLSFVGLPKFVHSEAYKLVMSLSQESEPESITVSACWTSNFTSKLDWMCESGNTWVSSKLLGLCELSDDYNSVLQLCPSEDSRFWECKCFGIVPNGRFVARTYHVCLCILGFALGFMLWSRLRYSDSIPVISWKGQGYKTRKEHCKDGKLRDDDEEAGGTEDPDFYDIPGLRDIHVDRDEVVVFEEGLQLAPATPTEMATLHLIQDVFPHGECDIMDSDPQEEYEHALPMTPRRSNQRRWTYSQSSGGNGDVLDVQSPPKGHSALNKSKSMRIARPKLNAYASSRDGHCSGSEGRRRAVTLSKSPACASKGVYEDDAN